MRRKTTLANLIGKVDDMSRNHHDEYIGIDEMEFDSLESMAIGNNLVQVLPSAQRLIANRLRIPHAYLSRCPQDLQADNLNYWLGQEKKRRETLFCRFDGYKLRAVFTEKYTAIDHGEVIDTMLRNDFRPEAEVHYSLDETMLVAKFPEYNRTFGLNGDRIVPGISIANSEVGILALRIEAYFYRLVCTNGLIAKTPVTSRFKHISRRVLDEFPYVLERVVDESRHSQDKFTISMNTPVEKPAETLKSFNKQFQLSKKEAEAVNHAWDIEPGATMFQVVNAYTSAAKNESLTAQEAYKLEKTGGQILSLVRS